MEAAGLVIGVVSIASLFEGVISGLDRLQTGQEFDDRHERYLLQLEVLKLRLHRWRDAVRRLTEEGSRGFASVRDADGQLAEQHLKVIEQLLQKESQLSEKYNKQQLPCREEEQVCPNKNWMIKSLRRVTQRHTRTIDIPPPTNLRRKISWAIRGEQSFKDLVTNLSTHINNLEHIIPTEEMRKLLSQMRSEDAKELITQPEATPKDTDHLTELVFMLDQPFGELIKARAANQWVGNVAEDNARIMQGDFVSNDYDGPMVATPGLWKENVAKGNSQIIQGNVYRFNPFSD